MYNNPYTKNYNTNFNQQNMYEQIDNQINQLQQMREQMKNNSQQPSINQTFQLAPNASGMKYVNTIDDVSREVIYMDTPFFSKDMSVVWIKNAKGEIKSYELTEIVLRDDKDIMIQSLQTQINELKGMIKDEHNADANGAVESTKSSSVSVPTTSPKKSK